MSDKTKTDADFACPLNLDAVYRVLTENRVKEILTAHGLAGNAALTKNLVEQFEREHRGHMDTYERERKRLTDSLAVIQSELNYLTTGQRTTS
ncbi:MAG: hypothetical protein A2845_04940 [Candidatus Lloydbacteria bacterium RIFCSPHIGHO2_01_FULL_49_22]|uniref:Uncharacterized protein n=1 Tax=Candidatus Lloydbacteria bacterium RIFCSPHIGHO2_01_FULL_49_22 TaxID=1798658 RepID=A0A1G2CWE4_9BACT|nr:MAG: hypothetical protein A2845_04940 [Candidatus Lloydbacteria bacterium RIFCSPHIGHO2_01_FULL_49_22]OGZ10157.1 MAG: hypothetical protein A3C14_00975 [Candidatus Lloydbacteria bacterium RIFCSPHIGHO2_02_FULL_50_18]